MSTAAKRRHAATAFITLLILAVVWPSPIVSMNRLWWGADLDVDELSFLGREAPSWDVAFWFFGGILLLAMLQSAESTDVAPVWQTLRAWRWDRRAMLRSLAALAVAGAATLLTWQLADRPMLAWAESIRTEVVEDALRLVNRFGGGMNPGLIVLFFIVGGVVYVERSWLRNGIAMALSGLVAGLLVQAVKHLVGRARPELWLGPEHYAPGTSTSFPSGHTVGAFALAGALVLSSRNAGLRIVAIGLACAVGLSRIVSFRHWASDVVASACIGLITAYVVVRGMSGSEREGHSA